MHCNPGLENETYRAIAAKTDVALGMVNWVLNELNELGYLVEHNAECLGEHQNRANTIRPYEHG